MLASTTAVTSARMRRTLVGGLVPTVLWVLTGTRALPLPQRRSMSAVLNFKMVVTIYGAWIVTQRCRAEATHDPERRRSVHQAAQEVIQY
jgi:hypothetical protein